MVSVGREHRETKGPQMLPLEMNTSRRRFLGYVLGGTTLVAAADLVVASPASAAGVPTPPQVAELYDLNDFVTW